MNGTLEEIEQSLPFGLTNAELRRLEIDFRNGTAVIELGIAVAGTVGDWERRGARICLSGLTLLTVEPPHPNYFEDYLEDGAGPPWVSRSSGHEYAELELGTKHLSEIQIDPGQFAYRLLVHDWNSYIHFRANKAELEWLD